MCECESVFIPEHTCMRAVACVNAFQKIDCVACVLNRGRHCLLLGRLRFDHTGFHPQQSTTFRGRQACR